MIHESILDLVGETPIVKLQKITAGLNANVLVKLEYFNPCGSIKERIALRMLEQAQITGKVNQDTLIIEPTSGNTGIGLAMVAAVKGYAVEIYMPEHFSIERIRMMSALGAKVVLTPKAEGMQGAINRANERAKSISNSFIPQQFENDQNVEAHYTTTGPEIWQQTDEQVAAFVASVGTGGTFSGVSRFLKEKNPKIKCFAAEPAISAVLAGKTANPHKIQGIGAGFVPQIMNCSLIDEILSVTEEEAYEYAKKAAALEGIFCGISAGANIAAALKIAQRPEFMGKQIVTILPDSGERYLSSDLYN